MRLVAPKTSTCSYEDFRGFNWEHQKGRLYFNGLRQLELLWETLGEGSLRAPVWLGYQRTRHARHGALSGMLVPAETEEPHH